MRRHLGKLAAGAGDGQTFDPNQMFDELQALKLDFFADAAARGVAAEPDVGRPFPVARHVRIDVELA